MHRVVSLPPAPPSRASRICTCIWERQCRCHTFARKGEISAFLRVCVCMVNFSCSGFSREVAMPPQVTPVKKTQAVARLQNKETPERTAQDYGVNVPTLYRWRQRVENNIFLKRTEGSGRPFCTTPTQDNELVQHVRKVPFTTARLSVE